MIAGLPWTAWLLLLAATGPALALVLFFYFKHRTPRPRPPESARSGPLS